MRPSADSHDVAFGVLEKDVLAEKISARLLSLIAKQQLRPGDKLPPERELAAIMQVSRPSLREALRALAMMHIIEIRQGSGTYVASLEPEMLIEHLDLIVRLDDSTFVTLLEARKVIESGLAHLAARRITEEQIAGLEDCLQRSRDGMNDSQALLLADLELHDRITKAAGNSILSGLMATISRASLVSRSRTIEATGAARQVVEDHQDIISAIRARDPEMAAAAMRRHLDRVEGRLAKALGPDEMG